MGVIAGNRYFRKPFEVGDLLQIADPYRIVKANRGRHDQFSISELIDMKRSGAVLYVCGIFGGGSSPLFEMRLLSYLFMKDHFDDASPLQLCENTKHSDEYLHVLTYADGFVKTGHHA